MRPSSRQCMQQLISCGMESTSLCIVLFAMIVVRGGGSPAAGIDDQVKALTRRYEQVEAQLDRSVRYIRKTESDGGTTIEQIWCNGAGDLIKVAIERRDSSGRELTEYFAQDFENASDGMFILMSKESL